MRSLTGYVVLLTLTIYLFNNCHGFPSSSRELEISDDHMEPGLLNRQVRETSATGSRPVNKK